MSGLRKYLHKWHRTYERARSRWHHLSAILWPSKTDEPVIKLVGKVWILMHGARLHQRIYCYANAREYVEVQLAVSGIGRGIEGRPTHQKLDVVKKQSLEDVGWSIKVVGQRSFNERWYEARELARRHLAGV